MSSDEPIRYTLSIPPRLHAAMRELATRERRSLHAEMLYLLERAVEEAGISVEGQESKRAA